MQAKYLKIKDQLIEEMRHMKPGANLPNRNDLAQKYNVSRITIERAISELTNKGYLSSRRGSGTFVSGNGGMEEAKTTASDTWALLLSNIIHDLYPYILRGVEDYAHKVGKSILICNTDNNPQKQDEYISRSLNSGVKDFIIIPAISFNASNEIFLRLKEHKANVVACIRTISGFDFPGVLVNSFQAGYKATKHLIEKGCKRIAFVAMPKYNSTIDRLQGYLTALNVNHIPLDENLVVYEKNINSSDVGYLLTKNLLENTQVDGIFAFNDRIAAGVYRAAEELGFTIGKDIKIIGCDNTDLCLRFPVKLSSISFNHYKIGELCATNLQRLINGEDAATLQNIFVDAEVFERESSI